ncbi:MAG: pyrophosphatase [Gammaproteobacteria bacterium]|nr:pyrophosphatase [Gammaproteobacteria bacterium]
MNNRDSFSEMMKEVQAFHDKHQFSQVGGEDMVYRVALMAEELGEISACVTKGKSTEMLAEECADLLILLLGNAISKDFDLNNAFWMKMNKISKRSSRMIDGRVRVSNFEGVEEKNHGT